MTTIRDNVQINQGDGAVLEYNAGLDLTGYSVVYRISERGNNNVIEYTAGSGITITDAAAGEFEVALNSADTAQLVPGKRYKHELRATNDATSQNKTVMRGDVSVLDSAFD